MIGMFARELRSEHCKIYVEPTIKKAIEKFASREGLTFSEAGRVLWLNSNELRHELAIELGDLSCKVKSS